MQQQRRRPVHTRLTPGSHFQQIRKTPRRYLYRVPFLNSLPGRVPKWLGCNDDSIIHRILHLHFGESCLVIQIAQSVDSYSGGVVVVSHRLPTAINTFATLFQSLWAIRPECKGACTWSRTAPARESRSCDFCKWSASWIGRNASRRKQKNAFTVDLLHLVSSATFSFFFKSGSIHHQKTIKVPLVSVEPIGKTNAHPGFFLALSLSLVTLYGVFIKYVQRWQNI